MAVSITFVFPLSKVNVNLPVFSSKSTFLTSCDTVSFVAFKLKRLSVSSLVYLRSIRDLRPSIRACAVVPVTPDIVLAPTSPAPDVPFMISIRVLSLVSAISVLGI